MKRLIFNAKKRSYWNTTIRHIHFRYFSKGAVIASTFYLFHLFHSIAVTQLLSLCTLYTRIRSFLIQRISTCAQRLPMDWGFDVKGQSSGCVVTTSCLRFCDSGNIMKFKLNNHPPHTPSSPSPGITAARITLFSTNWSQPCSPQWAVANNWTRPLCSKSYTAAKWWMWLQYPLEHATFSCKVKLPAFNMKNRLTD